MFMKWEVDGEDSNESNVKLHMKIRLEKPSCERKVKSLCFSITNRDVIDTFAGK